MYRSELPASAVSNRSISLKSERNAVYCSVCFAISSASAWSARVSARPVSQRANSSQGERKSRNFDLQIHGQRVGFQRVKRGAGRWFHQAGVRHQGRCQRVPPSWQGRGGSAEFAAVMRRQSRARLRRNTWRKPRLPLRGANSSVRAVQRREAGAFAKAAPGRRRAGRAHRSNALSRTCRSGCSSSAASRETRRP